MSLLDILSGIGTVLDTPRAMSWALASGRDPFEAMLDPSKRLTGWDLMKKLGVQNQEGFDATDVGAVGSEMVLDPLNVALMGAPWLVKKLLGAMGKGAKTVKGAKAAEGLTKGTKMPSLGSMPKKVAKATKAVDESGKPVKLFHGTMGPEYAEFSASKSAPYDWLPGAHFTTTDATEASRYAGGPLGTNRADLAPHVRMYYADVRNPIVFDDMPTAARTLKKQFGENVTEGLKAAGYDAVQVGTGKKKWFAVFDTGQLYAPRVGSRARHIPPLAIPRIAAAAAARMHDYKPERAPAHWPGMVGSAMNGSRAG